VFIVLGARRQLAFARCNQVFNLPTSSTALHFWCTQRRFTAYSGSTVQQGVIDDRPSLKFYARFIITKPPFTAPQSLLIELSHQQLMYVIAVIEHH
jgi:hypothetical protein